MSGDHHEAGSGDDDYVIIDPFDDPDLQDFHPLDLEKSDSIHFRSLTAGMEGALDGATAIANLATKILET
jgi:hypothetical protein